VEDGRARDDRDRVGEQRGEPSDDQRTASLKAHLQQHRPRPVAGDENRHEEQVAPDGRLGGDVAGGERDAGRRAEGDAGPEPGTREGDQCCASTNRADQPQDKTRPGRLAPRAGATGERPAQQREPGDRESDAEALARVQPAQSEARDQHRQNPDPARGYRLHERERRERQRNNE
jgi:hypothetical protein